MLLPAETFQHYYLNLYLNLADDPVAEVRNNAAKSFARVCLALKSDQAVFDEFRSKIYGFASSKKSSHR